jgi:hypothetical protein
MTAEQVSDLALDDEHAFDQIQEAKIGALDAMPEGQSVQEEADEASARSPLARRRSARNRLATKPSRTRRRTRISSTGSSRSDRGTIIALSMALGEAHQELVDAQMKLAVSEIECRHLSEQNAELKSLRVQQEKESRRAQLIRRFILISGGLAAGISPNIMSIHGITQYTLAVAIAGVVFFLSEVPRRASWLR